MTKEGRKCPDCIKAKAAYDRLDARMAQRGNFGIVPLPIRCEMHRLTTATDEPKNGNPHIIVGPNRRCLCGVYGIASTLGERAVSCAELLSKLESLVQTRNTDAFELWEAISPLVEDCSPPTPPTPAGAGTETPLTDSEKIACELMCWSVYPLGAGCNQAEFHRVSRSGAELIRELRRQAEADRALIVQLSSKHIEKMDCVTATTSSEMIIIEAPELPESFKQGMKECEAQATIDRLRAQLASANKDRERMLMGDMRGKLTRVGTFPIRDEETTGFVVSCHPEALAAIQRLPMYRDVVIVELPLQPSPSLDHGAREANQDKQS